MTINELASEYLSFTGRLAATLSVSEYLEFARLAKECNEELAVEKSLGGRTFTETCSNTNDIGNTVKREPDNKENYLSQKTYADLEIHDEPIEKQEVKADVSSYQVRREAKPQVQSNNSVPRTNTQQTNKKTNILAMLQSVSG